MLSAEYGGSGGKPIESGMVVEEPDIEIGQGVSSKAISRRMQTDKGGQSGPKSGRDYDEDEHRRDRRRDDDRKDRGHGGSAPFNLPNMSGIPSYPYGMPQGMPQLVNGIPMFPPGFTFPSQPQQPPPPGRG